ncbi:hypothetical protein D3C87_1962500 [compost metagenome]
MLKSAFALNSSVAKPSACSAVVRASISWLSQGLQTSGTIMPTRCERLVTSERAAMSGV